MRDAATKDEDLSSAPGACAETAAFDYARPADLFTRRDPAAQVAAGTSRADAERSRSRSTHRHTVAYRRFASGAEAIRFAIEELPLPRLAAAVLVVDGERHEAVAIRGLYARADYPLARRAPVRTL